MSIVLWVGGVCSVCACVCVSIRVRASINCVPVKNLFHLFLNFNLLEPLSFFENSTLPGEFSSWFIPGSALVAGEVEMRSGVGPGWEASSAGIVVVDEKAAEVVVGGLGERPG